MGKITDNLTKAEIARLRELFLGNEADSDEYRECQPSKTFEFLTGLGEDLVSKHHERIMEALVEWTIGYMEDLRANPESSYPGARSWESIGNIIFDIHIEQDEHPYYGNDLVEIRKDLED